MMYLRLRSIVILLSIIILHISCNHSQNNETVSEGILDFDIASDGQSIIFTWTNNGSSSIYKANVDGSNLHELFRAKDNLLTYLPRYSFDDSKVVFIRRIPSAKQSSVWILDIKKNNLKKVLDNNSLIIEATFSYDNKSLYFTKANDYAGYSPLSRKAAHDFDIYSLNLNNDNISKISNLNAYSLYHITDLNSDQILFAMRSKDDGVFLYNKKENKLKRIVTLNDTINNSKTYSNPVLIDNDVMVCSSYYELVKINMKTQTESQILSSTGTQFKDVKYNRKTNKLFFRKNDNSTNIYSVNIDGSDLKEISFNGLH
ncbi:TolB family protein [Pedobacter montanisoli]|uniref:DUF5050 domain-containing protein n=1 Tax=Pedobacter montanisoli TaxID=2923277 RepID=A0ABS9ZZE6_9SPHI|nr:hypothetical protein [Pedobacter montanisoli]MCJ0743673.1 hypothetical protein [Pedobacter montanisoli]